MTHKIKQFSIADARTFDGDPFDVADRAVRQAAAVAVILVEALDGAKLMARNAEMERQLQATGECSAEAWQEGPQGRRFATIQQNAEDAVKALTVLAQAAGYNPKHPPKAS